MVKIKAVLFDMGGTLVRVESIPETYQRILKAHGIERSNKDVAKAWQKASKELDFKRMPELGTRFWVEMNLLLLECLGVKQDALSLAEAIDREWWEYAEVSLYPEALEVMSSLKEKQVKIGIVTNSLEADMRKVLSKLNLVGFFDIEVNIDAVGKVKPEREIFMYALERLDLQPEEVLFVGDQVEIDYRGALKAGLKALLIDRDDEAKRRVKKVRNLHEILPRIKVPRREGRAKA